jgi:hypothetical protein
MRSQDPPYLAGHLRLKEEEAAAKIGAAAPTPK